MHLCMLIKYYVILKKINFLLWIFLSFLEGTISALTSKQHVSFICTWFLPLMYLKVKWLVTTIFCYNNHYTDLMNFKMTFHTTLYRLGLTSNHQYLSSKRKIQCQCFCPTFLWCGNFLSSSYTVTYCTVT